MSFDPERPFSTASKDGRIELILFQMKMYFQSQIDCTMQLNRLKSAAMLDNRARLGYTWEGKLKYGGGMVRQQKPSQGWKMINEARDMAYQILQPHQSFFRHPLSAFDDRDLALYPDLSAHILRFFTTASATKLGCKHPVTIILYHLQEPQILADVVTMALEVLMDVAGEKLDPEVWSLKDFYCSILRWRGEYAAAESYGQRFLKQFEEVFGRFHRRTRDFQAAVSVHHFFQRLDELAEREYQDIRQRGHEDLGYRFQNRFCIHALRPLAWIWEERGDFTQSEEYWRQALAGAIEVWGVDHTFTAYLLVYLKESFVKTWILKHGFRKTSASPASESGKNCRRSLTNRHHSRSTTCTVTPDGGGSELQGKQRPTHIHDVFRRPLPLDVRPQ
jgi:hypothetical protein